MENSLVGERRRIDVPVARCRGSAPIVLRAVPLTFGAHQAPLVWLKMRAPRRVDGVAAAIGSMSPDFAYVLAGSRLATDAHHNVVGFTATCVVSMAVVWLFVRVVLPVLPAHLPQLGTWRLQDWRSLADRPLRTAPVALWVVIGAFSHVLFDSFTHDDGWFAQHVPAWRTAWFGWDVAGRDITAYRLAQHLATIAGCVWFVSLLRTGALSGSLPRRPSSSSPVATRMTHLLLWTVTLAGVAVGVLWAPNLGPNNAVAALRLAGATFVALCLGCTAVRVACRRQQIPCPATDR